MEEGVEKKTIMLPLNQLSIYGIGQRLWTDQDQKIKIADNMKRFGGSFVKALGELILRADRNNLMTIAENWSGLILEYNDDKWLSISKPKEEDEQV